jgi:hypothetical protein
MPSAFPSTENLKTAKSPVLGGRAAGRSRWSWKETGQIDCLLSAESVRILTGTKGEKTCRFSDGGVCLLKRCAKQTWRRLDGGEKN